jgi:hypothetical protein
VKQLLISIGLIIGITAFGQPETGFYKHMEGNISSNIYLVADLVCVDDEVQGTYYYYYDLDVDESTVKRYGKTMPINGSIDEEKNIQFREFSHNGSGAVYQGKLTSAERIEGIWQSECGTRNLPFELTESYKEGSIPFNVYFLKESKPLFDAKMEPRAELELTLLLPGAFDSPAVSDSVERVIMNNFFSKKLGEGTPLELMEKEKEYYFTHYVNTNTDLYENGNAYSWEKQKSITVHYNESWLLSLECYNYGFTGGSHGLPVSKYHLIDLIDGRDLSLDDIFRPDYKNDLTDVLNAELRKIYRLKPGASLKDAGFFTHFIEPTENFYINNDGIGFYYNRYEIAPYAMGSTDVFIPYSRLDHLIDNHSKLKKLVKSIN